jgi:hypothetical protein
MLSNVVVEAVTPSFSIWTRKMRPVGKVKFEAPFVKVTLLEPKVSEKSLSSELRSAPAIDAAWSAVVSYSLSVVPEGYGSVRVPLATTSALRRTSTVPKATRILLG